jgi:hypothetical protein
VPDVGAPPVPAVVAVDVDPADPSPAAPPDPWPATPPDPWPATPPVALTVSPPPWAAESVERLPQAAAPRIVLAIRMKREVMVSSPTTSPVVGD